MIQSIVYLKQDGTDRFTMMMRFTSVNVLLLFKIKKRWFLGNKIGNNRREPVSRHDHGWKFKILYKMWSLKNKTILDEFYSTKHISNIAHTS